MRKATTVIVAVIALAVTGCSGQGVVGFASQPTTSSVATACQEPKPEPTDAPTTFLTPEQEKLAFEYYRSTDRIAKLENLLQTLGNRLVSDMLNGNIPSTTYDMSRRKSAPADGYGILNSAPDVSGHVVVRATVKFVDGKIDPRSLVGLTIDTATTEKVDGVHYAIDTLALDCHGRPVNNGPSAGSWVVTNLTRGDFMALMTGNILANPNMPLDPSKTYVVTGLHGPCSVNEIKAKDDAFIREVNGLSLNSSSWH